VDGSGDGQTEVTRGRAPGGAEQELVEDDERRVEDPTCNQHPELVKELRNADALCERYFGEMAGREGDDRGRTSGAVGRKRGGTRRGHDGYRDSSKCPFGQRTGETR
jgi:hypothetical protein